MPKEVTLKALLTEERPSDRVKEYKFEEGMKILEELVVSVESGALPLEKAIQSYEVGANLIGHLRGLLSGAETRLKTVQQNAQGEIEVKG